MPWNITLDPKLPIIETTYSGVLSPQDLRCAVQATTDAVNVSGRYRLLGNCSQLEGGHSIFDLYALVEEINRKVGGVRIQEAVLLPPAALAADMVKFWETACSNRGINVRIFSDRKTAVDWLTA